MSAESQEGRTETATAAVTKSEKAALVWLALTIEEPGGVSGLLRRMSIADALRMHDELRSRLGVAGAA